ncbi:MAG: hypothetical protein P1U86_07225 [Verrucomicrobiales bacterium]|nr:hypothetical protein [Verrucomicrobiales bacterium]
MRNVTTLDRLFILGLGVIASAVCLYGYSSEETSGPPDADREAILAMAGEYEVTFNFKEEVALQEGYELTEEYNEDANELVLVVEDTPTKIALQHILLSGNRVVKHWRQVWTWEDTRIVEFQGRNQWIVKTLDPELVKGTWSQLVTQVDDSPRYESYGAWDHSGGYSRWESLPTARPLPRREYTKRDDYEILLGVNRHAITPAGWVHGQDNLKKVISESGELVKFIAREDGLNYYDRVDDADFTKAKAYWDSTKEFWAMVVKFWDGVEAGESAFSLAKATKEKSLPKAMFAIADGIHEDGKSVPTAEEVEKVIREYYTPSAE